ncbi:UDP-glycosyltransferase UGT5-like [Topomyia yanbarensis]|uniref:UDP-glycosyltransferase UGT5-like n=1 Tax=Topomyia yanbarensis TaxID=2498891 RepID=UPI00273B0DC2|nr:UDP-glycosyltransferase UGT5-like [Topomyia yanbarensis]
MGAKVAAMLVLLTVALLGITAVHSHKILFLAPFNGPSHWLMLKSYIRELTNRGHEVTCITGIKFGEALGNYTEVLIDPAYPLNEKFPLSQLYNSQSYSSDLNNLFLYWRLGLATSRHGLEADNVQKFLKRDDLHFDLIVSEQFFQDSWLMFAYKYNAPIVTISTYGYSDFMDRAMGLLTPWSCVPHMLLDYEHGMNFFQRSYNVFLSTLDYILREYYYMPEMNKMAKEFFSELEEQRGPLPTIQSLEKSISVILVNSHPTLAKPRPTMVTLVSIGGAPIRAPKALPQELQRFMDEAEHGVIYFSLGAYMQSSAMPIEKRLTLLKVFGKLKQRVIWKFETDQIGSIPKNVMISKWAPQNDILAHKNTVLFISHGGQFGTFESMYHGVPTLFIPFFGDQHRNAIRAVRSGYAAKILFADITEESIFSQIRELVDTKQYYKRAKEISTMFRDTLVDPMNTSIYWMEYVIRYKGAPHLKFNAVNDSIVQYLLLDILGAAVLLLVLLIIVVKMCCCRKPVITADKKKRQ